MLVQLARFVNTQQAVGDRSVRRVDDANTIVIVIVVSVLLIHDSSPILKQVGAN